MLSVEMHARALLQRRGITVVDEKSEVESKKGISVLVMTLGCVVSVLLGLAGGVLGGPTIKATLGMEVEAVSCDIC